MIMANTHREGTITYTFPEHFIIFRPQDSPFYSKHWQSFAKPNAGEGNAEIDFVAFDPREKRIWLVETKDYRQHDRQKPSGIGEEFARKCRDTLSLLGALQVSTQVVTPDDLENRLRFSTMREVACVLHLEQRRGRRGEYSVISPQTLKDTIRRSIRALDPHAKAGDATFLAGRTLPFTILV